MAQADPRQWTHRSKAMYTAPFGGGQAILGTYSIAYALEAVVRELKE